MNPRIHLTTLGFSPEQGISLGQVCLAVVILSASGCAKPLTSRDADPSRQAAPIPACVQRLSAPKTQGGMKASLREPQYWGLVFPTFDQRAMRLPDNAVACNGVAVFQDPVFSGARPRHGEAWVVEEGDIVYGGGGAQLKLVWLQTHVGSDGSSIGPLAIVRVLDDGLAEVYAIGVHESRAEARLTVQRVGNDLVVEAADEGCVGRPDKQPCESDLTIYYPWKGELAKAANIALERVAYASDSEPGVTGLVEYRLVSTLEYKQNRVNVLEQISATDQAGREVRRAEYEFFYAFTNGEMKQNGESLWGRIAPKAGEVKPAPEPSGDDDVTPEGGGLDSSLPSEDWVDES